MLYYQLNVKTFSKRMIREVKRNKFGMGSKLVFEIITETGETFKQSHPRDIDQLVTGLCFLKLAWDFRRYLDF